VPSTTVSLADASAPDSARHPCLAVASRRPNPPVLSSWPPLKRDLTRFRTNTHRAPFSTVGDASKRRVSRDPNYMISFAPISLRIGVEWIHNGCDPWTHQSFDPPPRGSHTVARHIADWSDACASCTRPVKCSRRCRRRIACLIPHAPLHSKVSDFTHLAPYNRWADSAPVHRNDLMSRRLNRQKETNRNPHQNKYSRPHRQALDVGDGELDITWRQNPVAYRHYRDRRCTTATVDVG